eukprot:TRINITY_DN908_c0_g4_i1.p1 TRINITY_DN908_c0_g4~~TRINITY_DN908_c0_g4_i1.p1  ORF type:complete len:220 (+),score=39.92 TRINITY_DN908_c0_g4_i1:429-1088(+)
MKATVLAALFCWCILSFASGSNAKCATSERNPTGINVCFALDGSSSSSSASFRSQTRVVFKVVEEISSCKREIGYAAVQYGPSVTSISSLTTDRDAFVADVRSARQIGLDGNFATAGLNYCISEMFEMRETKNNIVLFGDGNSDIGRAPADRSELFFSLGGVVLAVGVGDSHNMTALQAIAGNNLQRVFRITANNSESAVADEISKRICGGAALAASRD